MRSNVKFQSHFALSHFVVTSSNCREAPLLDVGSEADGISATGGSAFG
jgi:hypothetical protein